MGKPRCRNCRLKIRERQSDEQEIIEKLCVSAISFVVCSVRPAQLEILRQWGIDPLTTVPAAHRKTQKKQLKEIRCIETEMRNAEVR
jgi:hypothetical protein